MTNTNLTIKNAKMHGESNGRLSYVVFDIELVGGETASVNYWHNEAASYSKGFENYDLRVMTNQLKEIYRQITGITE